MTAASPPANLARQLAELAELHRGGALTAEEFAQAKAHLLGSGGPASISGTVPAAIPLQRGAVDGASLTANTLREAIRSRGSGNGWSQRVVQQLAAEQRDD